MKILPGTGRETMQSMVEGARRIERRAWLPAPSVNRSGCHLPASGEGL